MPHVRTSDVVRCSLCLYLLCRAWSSTVCVFGSDAVFGRVRTSRCVYVPPLMVQKVLKENCVCARVWVFVYARKLQKQRQTDCAEAAATTTTTTAAATATSTTTTTTAMTMTTSELEVEVEMRGEGGFTTRSVSRASHQKLISNVCSVCSIIASTTCTCARSEHTQTCAHKEAIITCEMKFKREFSVGGAGARAFCVCVRLCLV